MNDRMTTIDAVCAPTAQIDPAKLGRDEFTYIDIASIDRESKSVSKPSVISVDNAPSRARKLVSPNDTLVSTVRPNLNAVAFVGEDLDGSIASTGFTVLRPRLDRIAPRFLFYLVRTPEFVNEMISHAKGANYPAVSDRIVRSHAFGLPELHIQNRIVEILDQVDILLRKRSEADALHDRIIPGVFQRMFGEHITSPENHVPMGSVTTAIESGASPKCRNRPVETQSEWGVLKLTAVTYNYFQPNANKALQPGDAPTLSYEVRPGDLLLSRKNTKELVGAAALVFETPPQLLLPDLIFRIVPDPKEIIAGYLWQALLHPNIRTGIRALATGAAGSMVNISKAKLREFRIPLPNLQLQVEFANLVSENHLISIKKAAATKNIETLFQTLLTRAFDGRLVGNSASARNSQSEMNELVQEIEFQSKL